MLTELTGLISLTFDRIDRVYRVDIPMWTSLTGLTYGFHRIDRVDKVAVLTVDRVTDLTILT